MPCSSDIQQLQSSVGNDSFVLMANMQISNDVVKDLRG